MGADFDRGVDRSHAWHGSPREPAGLYPDEAQYWFWAQHLAFGYYSKPPLVAWLIALTTALLGNGELGVRVAAPLLHAAAAGFVYAIGTRLYDRRIGFWSALAYATLPGVSLSSFIISTDAALLPCWAAALYAFVRAREPGGGTLVARRSGSPPGSDSSPNMRWPTGSSRLFALCCCAPRSGAICRALLAATALALLIFSPNLWWNWESRLRQFPGSAGQRPSDRSDVPSRRPSRVFPAQFGVFGPLFFAALIALVLRADAALGDRGRGCSRRFSCRP